MARRADTLTNSRPGCARWRRRPLGLCGALAATLLALSAAARADDPCAGFSWDVHAERALFGGAKTSQTAGHDEASAPGLSIATAYTLALVPQSQVEFAQPPGKGSKPEGMHAGLAKIRLVSAGAFRVALDVPAWIDVIAAGRPVPSRAFEGRHGCSAPHKVVEFDLPAGDALIQVSGASPDHVTLSVTPAPAPAT